MAEYKKLQKKMKELEIGNKILKKATAIFAKKTIDEYVSFINSNIDKYTVKQMCKALGFPRST